MPVHPAYRGAAQAAEGVGGPPWKSVDKTYASLCRSAKFSLVSSGSYLWGWKILFLKHYKICNFFLLLGIAWKIKLKIKVIFTVANKGSEIFKYSFYIL